MANQIELALAQFTGFKYGKWNSTNPVGLIVEMGLNRYEWIRLKSEESVESYFEAHEIAEIDEHFKK